MRALVRKWGNSASVRVPAPVLAAARLQLDQQVEISAEDGRIVIAPVAATECRLADLLDGITEGNLHASVGGGPPVGNEAL